MSDAMNGGGGDSERLQAALSRHFDQKIVASWLSDLECEEVGDDTATLSTASSVRRDAISQRFGPQLRDVLTDAFNRKFRNVSIVTRRRLSEDARRIDALKSALAQAPLNPRHAPGAGGPTKKGADRPAVALEDLSSPVSPQSTFDAFAVDETNEMAFAAARQIFVEGARADIIYFNGPSGVGKTHLLFAIANEHSRRFGDGGCLYIPYNALQNGTVNAVFANNMMSLQRDLLSKDVLLIDDVHLLLTSPRTQAELLNLVNAALASGKRLVAAGELTPQKLAAAGFNERLADRLSGGLSVALLSGDAAHRARVLRKRLALANAQGAIDEGAVQYIAENFTQSLREAIGALNQLQLVSAGREGAIGRADAEKLLKARVLETRRAPSFDEAAGVTAAEFGLTPEEFRSRGQHQRLVRARHAFVMICRENLQESFPRIARYLGRDHTTMMSGYKRAQALMERDKKLREQLQRIREVLGLGR